MLGRFIRGLLLVVLGMGVAGFGVCSLCGGAFAVSGLRMSISASENGVLLLGLGFAAFGAFMTWICWLGFRGLRRATQQQSSEQKSPGA